MNPKKCLSCGREFESRLFGLRPWNCPVCGIRHWEGEYWSEDADLDPSRPRRVGEGPKWTPSRAAEASPAVFWFRWAARILTAAVLIWSAYYFLTLDWEAARRPPRQPPSPAAPAR